MLLSVIGSVFGKIFTVKVLVLKVIPVHHTRLIAKAAVVNDAMGIREQVQGLRQRVCAAHAAASGWP